MPVVIVSPIKKRAQRAYPAIKRMSDLDVWDMSDDEILSMPGFIIVQGMDAHSFVGVAFHNARSPVYDHYDITVEQIYGSCNKKLQIDFIFTCKADPDHHTPHRCARGKMSSGTSNLVSGERQCLQRRGIVKAEGSGQSSLVYSEALHWVLIVLRCVASARPFNMIIDKWYKMEVEMLWPGTVVLHPATISSDLQCLYSGMSLHIGQYLLVCSFSFC